ncbi:DUF4783 domain-containing protein [Alkalitalea saponilacus]|uniref:DUF4783 domain-containing protein n=1 Tax=Alkalitalea saponilacus TaxID=889453 RepID=A0A1T5HTP9_9BACT|nr:DUF4783 domain-containing protein [Alkalitalea saponilacus]ASB48507.1 DUF4783 domain-containing protein [Alkalitalea saponilacus]SKC23870.1 protein of unknown function [Alkalitalea saponilacus]
MKLEKLLLVAFLLCSLPLLMHGQTEGKLQNEIVVATRNGDSGQLSQYFNDRIELVLPGQSGVYSREQARFLVKDFFDSHPPVSFQVIHQGVRENATFAIGRYHFNTGQFRILFLTKRTGDKTLIHQIRVERQDD